MSASKTENLTYDVINRPYSAILSRSNSEVGMNDVTGVTQEEGGRTILSGQALTDAWIDTWIKSTGYEPKKRGFLIDGQKGYIECMKLWVGNGGIVGGYLDIPDQVTANSFHVDPTGNTWWGATTLAASTASILNTGLGTFSNIVITGGSVGGTSVSDISNLTSTVNIVPLGLTVSSTGVNVATDGTVSAFVTLTWTAVVSSTFDHYQIRYKKDSYTYYQYLDSTANTITIDGLVPNTDYNFNISSVNRYGSVSAWTTTLIDYPGGTAQTIQKTASSTTPPATVTSGSATAGIQCVVVRWTANTESDLASYNVYRKTTNDSSTSILWANIRTNYFIDSGMVSDGTVYYYWVKAVNTSGLLSSAYSTEVHATPHNVASSDVNIANQGWTQTCVFSTTDADTVTWGAGVFTASNGTSYNILTGNTGNMVARTYIYLDISISTTAYQTTTTATSAVGDGKVLIATAKNNTTVGAVDCTFQVFGGSGGITIDGGDIIAESITTNEIAANTIEAGNIKAGTITSTEINTSSITSLSNLNIAASQVLIDGATTFLNTWFSYKGIYNAGTIYSKGDQVTYLTNYWNYINITPSSGNTPAENTYWTAGGASQVTTIDGGEITTGTVTTSTLNFVPVQSTNVIASINASAEGIKIDADNLRIGTATNYWDISTAVKTALTATAASTDVIINYGKTDFGDDTTSGFIFGYDFSASKSKFEMGSSATKIFRYDGTDISLVGGSITGGSIAIGSANNIFKADANGIYLGNATFASAPFRVTPAGALTASSATITGALTTGSGSSINAQYFANNSNIINTLIMGDAVYDGYIKSYGWDGSSNGYQIVGGPTPSISIIGGSITGTTLQTSSAGNTGVKMSSGLGGIVIYGETLQFNDTSGNIRGYMGSNGTEVYWIGVAGKDMKVGSYQDIILDAAAGAAVWPARLNVDLGQFSYYWRGVFGQYYYFADNLGVYLTYSSAAIQASADFRVSGSINLTGNMVFENDASITIGGRAYYQTTGAYDSSKYYLRSA